MMISISFPVIVFVIIFIMFSQSSDQCEEASVGTKIRSEQHAINTFQIQYGGDTYDCVDIYKQFSMTHHLLKNHKIQMRPSSKPKNMLDEDDSSSKLKKTRMRSTNTTNKHLDIISEGVKSTCPRGTVPVRRSSSLTQQPSSDFNQNAFLSIFQGIMTKNRPNKIYHGASARMALHNPPKITTDQMSGVVISIESGGDRAFLNKIESGWMVNPKLYGDTKTRLYTRWTADDGYRTGCYNIQCPGFIITSSEIPIDLAFNETTTDPNHMVQIDLSIFQEKDAGNWWLAYGQKHKYIGYWPKEIVTNLTNGAPMVQMGGIVSSPDNEPTPPMGNGFKFLRKFRSFYNCAFFAQIQFLDDTYQSFHGDNSFIDTTVSNRCYRALDTSYIDYKLPSFGFVFGYSFLFGGQGGDEVKCQ